MSNFKQVSNRVHIRVVVLLLIIAAFCLPVSAASLTTIERVYLFPEQYLGQTLVFDNATIDGELGTDEGRFMLRVESEAGKWIGAVMLSEGFGFAVSDNIASQLVSVMEPNYSYRARLTVTMKTHPTRYRVYNIAEVTKIEFYGRTGSIVETVTEAAASAPQGAPTIERVYLFPEQYIGQTLVFDNATIDGELGTDEGRFMLRVESEAGKWIGAVMLSEGFGFAVSDNIASQLVSVMEPNYSYRARLTVTMKTHPTRYRVYNIAEVTKIEFYGRTGSIVETVTEAAASAPQGAPTIERVYLFPEQYLGQTLVFDNATIDGELGTDEGRFMLRVESEAGKWIGAVMLSEGFGFAVSDNIASQLVNVMEPNYSYRARLTVTMKTHPTRYRVYNIAEVTKIEFYGRTGSIVETVR